MDIPWISHGYPMDILHILHPFAWLNPHSSKMLLEASQEKDLLGFEIMLYTHLHFIMFSS